MSRLIEAGFWVISIDQRGHGDSGGDVRLMDPDHEGKNLLQILDWAEANLPHLLYRDDNLVLGAVGASYGGGYQMLLLASTPSSAWTPSCRRSPGTTWTARSPVEEPEEPGILEDLALVSPLAAFLEEVEGALSELREYERSRRAPGDSRRRRRQDGVY